MTVYAPQWKGADDFDAKTAGYQVVRHPGTVMLPAPPVDVRMRRLIAEHRVDTVWFGAAAPLALLAGRARQAGAGGFRFTGPADRPSLLTRMDLAERVRAEAGGLIVMDGPAGLRDDLAAGLVSGRADLVSFSGEAG